MEPFISQQIWKISKRHWRQNKNSCQHHQVHVPTRSTNRTDERCHIWAICVHGATRKGGTQSNAVHCRGDRINYPGAVATPTAEMLVAKMLFNSVISTKDTRFMTMDISNFYPMTPLHRPEFIRVKLSNIPDEVIKEYKIRERKPPKMAASTSRPSEGCTAYHNQDYWQTNSSKNV